MHRTTPIHGIAISLLLFIVAANQTPTFAQNVPFLGIEEGQAYPDFLLPTVDDKHARLSDYRGKKILLFHFASW